MKKSIIILLSCILALSFLSACQNPSIDVSTTLNNQPIQTTSQTDPTQPTPTSTVPPVNSEQEPFSYVWESTYYGNQDYPGDHDYPIVIRSVAELQESGFLPYSKGYDDAFFMENSLLIVLCFDEFSNCRFEVSSMTKESEDSYLLVIRDARNGSGYGDEFSEYHCKIFIEVNEVISEDAVIELLINPSTSDQVNPTPN